MFRRLPALAHSDETLDALAATMIGEGPRKLAAEPPLRYYILCEAEEFPDPKTGLKASRLGPVGARIMAEVIIGLLAADPTSYLGVAPNWTPDLGEDFGRPELVTFATAGPFAGRG